MKIGALILLLLIPLAMPRQSESWRGITPLKSTCEDVKRILKVDQCTFPISRYSLSDFRVIVEFEHETCRRNPRSWRVPRGTVTALEISPQNHLSPSDFGIDISKYEKREAGEIVGMEHYDSPEEGVTVDLYKGFVQNVFLFPRKSDEALRCKPLK